MTGALALADQRKRTEAQEADETRRHNLRVYCELLVRDRPEADDVRNLADAIEGLGFSAAQVTHDRSIIAEYRRWLAWHGRRDELKAASAEANKRREELRRRAHQEVHDAMFAADRIAADLSDANAARAHLARIEGAVPHLADGGLFALLQAAG